MVASWDFIHKSTDWVHYIISIAHFAVIICETNFVWGYNLFSLFFFFFFFWWWDYKTALQVELWGLLFLSRSFKAFTVQVTFFSLSLFHNVYIYINCSEQNVQIYNFNFERGKRWIAANKYYAYAHDHCFKWQRKNHLLPDKKHIPVITLSNHIPAPSSKLCQNWLCHPLGALYVQLRTGIVCTCKMFGY